MSKRRAEHTSIRGWLTQVVAWFVIAAVLLVLAVSVLIPRLAGAHPYTILTDSMRPGMPPGTLVVVRPIDATDIRIGMVVTYQLESGKPAVVTHRVVGQGYNAKGDLVFTTQGDANDIADERPVLPVQIKGERWYYVPHLGRVTNAVTNSQRRAAITIVAVGLFGYAATMFAGAARDRRKTRDTLKEQVRS
jgi:signal peptidase